MRWPFWRRDLVVGLLAAILTATALVPVGWLLVRNERRQTEEARGEAERNAARVHEYEAQIEAARRAALEQMNVNRRLLADRLVELANSPGVSEEERAEHRRRAAELRNE